MHIIIKSYNKIKKKKKNLKPTKRNFFPTSMYLYGKDYGIYAMPAY